MDQGQATAQEVIIPQKENGYHEFTEGKVKIACSGDVKTFYNPVQEFNRDLTVSVLRQFVKDRENASAKDVNGGCEPPLKKMKVKQKYSKLEGKIEILDALSASGLRALRFAKEVPGVESIIANDFSEEAVEAIKRNIEINGVGDLVKPSFGDAVDVLMSHRAFDKRFHAVDLDPYGSAANFLDSAVQAVADKGVLMVTCTDTAVLCGNAPEACFNKYGAVPLRHRSCHEIALRIVLKAIDAHASRHGRYIKPLLSISIDFYVRCFVQLDSSALIAKDCVTKLSHVFSCASCHSLEFQPLLKKTISETSIRFMNGVFRNSMILNNGDDGHENQVVAEEGASAKGGNYCAHCGGKSIHMAGPIYTAPMHDEEFVMRLLKGIKETPEDEQLGTHERLIGVLTVISEEIHDVPLYYEHDQLMNTVKCTVPKHIAFRSAIINAGYRCSISHCNAKALKTDAPVKFLWDICRVWAKSNNINPKKFKNNETAKAILSAKCLSKVNFTMNSLAVPRSRTDCLLRFQDNKGKNWGPRPKAKGSVNSIKAGLCVQQTQNEPCKKEGEEHV